MEAIVSNEVCVMVTDREIPRAEWPRFFESFVRRHRNTLAKMSVITREYGARKDATPRLLDAIDADPTGGGVRIHLGNARTGLDRPVPDPRMVWVELNDRGEEVTLEIESERGDKTILEFRDYAFAPF